MKEARSNGDGGVFELCSDFWNRFVTRASCICVLQIWIPVWHWGLACVDTSLAIHTASNMTSRKHDDCSYSHSCNAKYERQKLLNELHARKQVCECLGNVFLSASLCPFVELFPLVLFGRSPAGPWLLGVGGHVRSQ
jgi:hypothetical protein